MRHLAKSPGFEGFGMEQPRSWRQEAGVVVQQDELEKIIVGATRDVRNRHTGRRRMCKAARSASAVLAAVGRSVGIARGRVAGFFKGE